MNNDIVVFSYRRREIKKFIENFLPSNLNKACIIEADYIIDNPGIIERLEWEYNQGKNIILVENGVEKKDFMKEIPRTQEFFHQERIIWVKNLLCVKKALKVA